MDEADRVSDEQLWARLADAEPGERAEITLELAERAADQEDHERTVTLGKAAVVAAESVASTTVQARATFLEADAHAALCRTDAALAGYSAAARLYRGLLDERGVAMCHVRAGWALSQADRLEEALDEWGIAERLLSDAYDCQDDLGRCRVARAGALQRLGRPLQALDALDAAREAFRRHGDPAETTWADDRAASVLLGLGRSSEAVDCLERSLSVAESAGDADALAYARLRLAQAKRLDGRHRAALRLIRRARRTFQKRGSLTEVAFCDREAAVCLSMLGENDKAHRRLIRSRAVSDAAGDDPAVRGLDLDLGILLWTMGRTEESLEVTRRALDASRAAQDQSRAFELTTRLADRLLDLDRTDEAAEVMREAPDAPADANVLERTLYLGARARLALGGGQTAVARALVDEGLALLDGTGLTSVQAGLYAVRAQATESTDETSSMADRARAVAMYLADGDPRRAKEVARPFLPNSYDDGDSRPRPGHGGPAASG